MITSTVCWAHDGIGQQTIYRELPYPLRQAHGRARMLSQRLLTNSFC